MRSAKLAILFAFKALGLFYAARWITRRRLKILCYHGFELVDETAFRPKLFIKAEHFERRLATIQRQRFHVLPLDEAIDRLYSGTLPDDALVITIDDGFHSFRRLAVPRLLHYGYPATVYVTTYYVRHAVPIFRLVVQYMFWKTRRREVELRGVSWSADCFIDLRDPAAVERAIWNCIDFGERKCDGNERDAICERLGELLETPYRVIVQSKILNLMTPEELRNLPAAEIAVELHTHRHTFPVDDPVAAMREIADNRAALGEWLAGEKNHFCYPSGLWDPGQWPWLDGLNIKSSTTCVSGMNTRDTPRHALKRFLDAECVHQLEFEAALSGIADLLRDARSALTRRVGGAALPSR